MKTTLIILIFGSVLLLAGCGSKNIPPASAVATTPVITPSLPTVRLTANNKGLVSHINLTVSLPAGQNTNLLQYDGKVTIQGTLQSTVPCIKSAHFNCQASIYSRTISAQSCLGSQSLPLQIGLASGQNIQESYSILSIVIQPIPMSCYLPNNS